MASDKKKKFRRDYRTNIPIGYDPRYSSRQFGRTGYFTNAEPKAVRLINFKSFKDSGWVPLKKLTFLMGNNSAGKSSIIKALHFLRQSITRV